MPYPDTVRRRWRLCSAITLTAAVTGSLTASVPAQAAPDAPAPARVFATGSKESWVSRGRSWQARHGRSAVRASATGPTTPSAVPAALKEYFQGDLTDLQWPMKALHVRDAWSATKGEGIVVATVDTGANSSTPDLSGQLLPAVHLDPATGTVVAGYRADRLGHGTHVAAIIAGNDDGHGVTGIAPGAKVLPINVDTSDELTGRNVAAAINYATARGAKVVNLSLGFADVATGAADVTAICTAVKSAVSKNVVIVAAAGNDGMGTNNAEAPASCPGAISVAAVDNNLQATVWSSFDRTVTVAAPGASVLSAVPTTTSPIGFSAESGTSMAAPYVAGLAALLLAKNPDWTPAQVSARLVETAADVPPAGRDPRSGSGLVDPAKALGVSADAPNAVPYLTVTADAYATRVTSGRPAYDKTLLHWVPDPTLQVTGYRVTRWAASGTTTTTYAPETVRALFPTGPAGYQVTALTSDGEVPSTPVWFPVPGQDPTPVYPVTSLKASWSKSGALVTWANPAQNKGRADEYAVFVNGEPVFTAEKAATIPTRYTIPLSQLPGGDLSISVLVGSSSSLDIAESVTKLAARVPFSGTAVSAGKGRYRIDLVLAPSRRSQCGSSRCTGTGVTVSVGGYSHFSRIDSRGHVVVLVSAKPKKGKLTAGVTVAGKPKLSDRAVVVPIG